MSPQARRTKRISDSLGDSWGDAEYEDESDRSIASVSDFDSSEEEVLDEPTPLPSRVNNIKKASPRAPSQQSNSPQTPVRKTSRSSTPSRNSPSSGIKWDSPEPSFIMPSMSGTLNTSPTKPSPLRNSQLSHRQPRRRVSATPEPRMQTSARSSPRMSKGKQEPQEPELEQHPWLYVQLFWENALRPLFGYVLSVIAFALEAMKPILSYILLFFLLVFLLSQGSVLIRSKFYSALSPVCILPGSSYILPFCTSSDQPKSGQAEFEDLVKVQNIFEDVLKSSVDGATLPLDMKRSESSIRDLKHVVRYSHLPSRNELEVEFQSFIDTARQASYDLTKFNSRIGRSVDQILSTNRWTLQILDGVAEKEAGTGVIPRLISAVNPMRAFYAPQTMHEIIFDQYLRHTNTIEENLQSLIQEAQALLGVLGQLDERLDMISSIATRDGIVTQSSKDELFERLWTKLGGNRSSVKKLNEQLQLLKSVTWYRKTAWNHVTATLLKLQEIATGLEDLRERVAEPEVLGYRDEVPLSFHLEHIKMGVERLEAVRGETRRVEGEGYRRVLDKADRGDYALPAGMSEGSMKTVYPNR